MRLRSSAPVARAALLFVLSTFTSAGARASDDPDPWLGADKAEHFALSAGIATTTYAATSPLFAARYPPLLLGAAVTLTVGAGKEAYDATSGGDPSWKDFTWDAIGMVAGLALGYALDVALRGVSPEHPLLGPPTPSGSGSGPKVSATGRGLTVTF